MGYKSSRSDRHVNRQSKITRRNLLIGSIVAPALAGCDEGYRKPLIPGHRIDILSSGEGLMVDNEDKTPITIPPPKLISEWPLIGRVPTHRGENYAWGGLHRRWRHDIGAGISEPDFFAWAALGSLGRGIIPVSPVVHNGRLFVMDAQGVVRAFSWPGMHKLWKLNPKSKKSRSSNLGGGIGVDGDTLYIVDGVAQALAVHVATGKVKWRVNINTPGRSAPTIANGKVFFGTIDERFFALDAKTGRQVWSYAATKAETTVFGQPAPAFSNGTVVAGFGGGDLVAFRADSGEVVWSNMLGNVNSQARALNLNCVRGLPVIVDNVVYAVSVAQLLTAVDMRTGRHVWERAVASQDNILCVGDWLFVLSLDQQVACLDRLSGHVRWITQLRRFCNIEFNKGIVTWFGPILAGGQLVCLSTLPANGMARLDPTTGNIISIDEMDAISFVSPIVVDNQMLILTNDGYLRSYG
ncbi:MAG: PQQ-binding-like beta-propeller repeat protein [Acetobacter sp.]|nr:PQQ-binding-like beta-propeller repeat protein [Acetobacter sp.]